MAEPEDAHRPAAQRRRQGKAPLFPKTVAQEAVGSGDPADRCEQKRHREVRDLFGQNVGRVGDHDAAASRLVHIDAIHADAKARDDRDLRTGVHHPRVDAAGAARRNAPDSRGDIARDRIGGEVMAMNLELPVERLRILRRHGRGLQDLDRTQLRHLHVPGGGPTAVRPTPIARLRRSSTTNALV
jgi:hypothetical protein